MTETEYIQNQRIALDEANRWLRYIDNFFWITSSFVMVGTGYATLKALEWAGDSKKVLIIGSIMIAGWILFLFFKRNIAKQSNRYFDLVNFFEQRLEIDILPERPNAIFGKIMTIVAILSIILWIALMAQFIVKNWFNLCNY